MVQVVLFPTRNAYDKDLWLLPVAKYLKHLKIQFKERQIIIIII